MTFSEFEYKRPTFNAFKRDFEGHLDKLKKTKRFEDQIPFIDSLNRLRESVETMRMLCKIRFELNTDDQFYQGETAFFNETQPKIEELVFDYYQFLLTTENRKKLEDHYGSQLFNLAALKIKSFSPEIVDDLHEENRLVSDYIKLLSKIKVDWKGKHLTLSETRSFFQSKDRKTRKESHEAYSESFRPFERQIDTIFDDMIDVRTKTAKKLGFDSFTTPAYMRLKRSGYTEKDIARFREQVVRHVVPLATSILKEQEKRTGVETLRYYDEGFLFNTGNAMPIGNPDELVEKAFIMFSQLSAETKEFFAFMKTSELFDLISREGKIGGGYCDYFNDFKAPFIFGNLNGTADDIKSFTHEGGHAFQLYSARDFSVPEYHFTTLDACEIHAMSMEMITYPYMQLFFGENALKQRFAHLAEAITFIPYCCLVDEFQHVVYDHTSLSPNQRKSEWRKLEKRYLPLRDYEENQFLEKGTWWYRQGHIFFEPFYYIDYAIAQICAFQFLIKFNDDRKSAWNDYLTLCKSGGSKPLVELLKIAKLSNPFDENTIKATINFVSDYIEKLYNPEW